MTAGDDPARVLIDATPTPRPEVIEALRRPLDAAMAFEPAGDRRRRPRTALGWGRRPRVAAVGFALAVVLAAGLVVASSSAGHRSPGVGAWRLVGFVSGPHIAHAEAPAGGLTCPAVTVCYIDESSMRDVTVNSHSSYDVPNPSPWLAVSADLGQTWTYRQLPDHLSFLPGPHLSCSSAMHCVTIGTRLPIRYPGASIPLLMLATTDGGRSWTWRPLPALGPLWWPLLTCPTATVCAAGGNSHPSRASTATIDISVDGGRRWRLHAFPHSRLNAVTCVSASYCIAALDHFLTVGVQSLVAVTRDAGATWTQWPTPTFGDQLACPSTTRCWLLDDDTGGADEVQTTDDGGHLWTVQRVPLVTPNLNSLACPTTRVCWIAGSTDDNGNLPSSLPMLVHSSDGGRRWVVTLVPADLSGSANQQSISFGLVNLSCPTADTCVATGASWQGITNRIPVYSDAAG